MSVALCAVPSLPPEWESLRDCLLLRGLPPRTLQDIRLAATMRRAERQAVLINQGDQPTAVFAVLKGRVKVFRSTETGDEIITRLLGPGDTLLESVVFYDEPSPVGAQTESEALLLSIPADTLRHMARRHEQLAMNLIGVLAAHTNEMMYLIEQVTLHPAVERVAGFLLRVMLEQHQPRTDFELPYEKAEIANHLGLTPETFSRCLKTLAGRGVKVNGKKVHLEEKGSLCAYCDPMLARRCADCNKLRCRMFGL